MLIMSSVESKTDNLNDAKTHKRTQDFKGLILFIVDKVGNLTKQKQGPTPSLCRFAAKRIIYGRYYRKYEPLKM